MNITPVDNYGMHDGAACSSPTTLENFVCLYLTYNTYA